jgi:DNA invertase Pin-like site-specific DNA recombinase
MKLIGYIRVSTEAQATEGVSLGAQEERIRAYAKFVGAEVVEILVDAGASGRKARRVKKLEAVRRVVSGEADALVVYAIDRLSRSTIDLLATVKELADAGAGFVSCREQLDSSTPHGRFTLTILAGLAEMESELIAERTREAMARCRREGRAVSSRTYGFRRVDDTKRVDEVPREMAIVERILALRDAGLSLNRVAERLNRYLVDAPRGKKWYPSSVKSVEETHRRLRRIAADA